MKNKGFTLLFASLVVSLLLSIGLAIANISLQQFQLSSAGKESQVAFYNADTGIECALYYDHGKVAGFQFPVQDGDPAGTMSCNGLTADGSVTTTFDNSTTTSTYIFNPATGCVPANRSFIIQVNKHPLANQTYYTLIQARGYDTCDDTNPRRVERGLEVHY